jgi:hypothetical protein
MSASPGPEGRARPAAGRPRLSRSTWVTLILFAVLAAFYLMVLSGAEVYYRPSGPAMSTNTTEPHGMAALYRYLAATGARPAQLTQFDTLPEPRATVIVAAGPLQRQPAASEIAALKQWVTAGGTLVLAAEAENALHAISGMRPGGVTGGLIPAGLAGVSGPGHELVTEIQPTALSAGVTRVEVDAGQAIDAIPDVAVVVLGPPAAPVMASRRIGLGKVVVLADEFALSNAGLAQVDDLALALDLCGGAGASGSSRVLFDEYHHGYASGGGAWGKLPVGVRLSLIQLMLAAGLVVVAAGQRLGRPRPPVLAPRTSPMEYVTSLAMLLRRAKAFGRASRVLSRSLERDLSGRLGTATRDREGLRRTLAARGWTASAFAVEQTERDAASEEELLADARAVTDARREAAGARRRDRRARRVP